MDNPDENVAFSIRSLVNVVVEQGKIIRRLKALFTYDKVIEPGIKIATQFDTVGLESITDTIIFTADDLDEAIELYSNEIGNEESKESLIMVRDEMGWQRVKPMGVRAIDLGV